MAQETPAMRRVNGGDVLLKADHLLLCPQKFVTVNLELLDTPLQFAHAPVSLQHASFQVLGLSPQLPGVVLQ